MAFYVIAHTDVVDFVTYRTYAQRAEEILLAYGGRVLVKGTVGQYAQGKGPKFHTILVFPDQAAADACYMCDEYQEILPLSMRSATRDVVMVEGEDLPELFGSDGTERSR
ncbi:MAG: DUF1330 domain-containing protein [Celeribacter marinus]